MANNPQARGATSSGQVLLIIFKDLEKCYDADAGEPQLLVLPQPSGLLGFPAGAVRAYETHEEAAVRVLREQTGLRLVPSALYSVETVDQDGVETTAFTVDLAELPEQGARALTEVHAHAEGHPDAYIRGFTAWLSLAANALLG